ncbi:hypothetical protein AK812_SmicGene12363 [Symbiodinium microadriaticum]|uniref:RNase H type-1 domain-containing protein n=1 Tax=Symbiodinium microadriaticum TaxID=2951 RepID=A0A1Q9EAT6_SYMMI|nr:hypothetical protein AK812_SmicGene12363 [Symbiodinium microadriaticum]
MFPPVTAMGSLNSLSALRNHYQVPQAVWDALEKQLGDFADEIRNLAAIPANIFAKSVETLELADGTTPSVVQATQEGTSTIDDWVDPDPWELSATAIRQTTTTSSPALAVTVDGERKVKMATILDQSDDSELTVDKNSSKDFLQALKASKYRSYVTVGEGEYMLKELPGPTSFPQWSACFKVYRTALIMLNAMSVARLQAYEDFVERMARRYTNCWHLIYSAEDRARAELSARIAHRITMRVAAGDSPPPGWSPSNPWDAVFKAILDSQDYWQEQLHQPALTWLANGGRGIPSTPQEEYAAANIPGGLAAITPPPEVPTGMDKGNATKAIARKRKRIKVKREHNCTICELYFVPVMVYADGKKKRKRPSTAKGSTHSKKGRGAGPQAGAWLTAIPSDEAHVLAPEAMQIALRRQAWFHAARLRITNEVACMCGKMWPSRADLLWTCPALQEVRPVMPAPIDRVEERLCGAPLREFPPAPQVVMRSGRSLSSMLQQAIAESPDAITLATDGSSRFDIGSYAIVSEKPPFCYADADEQEDQSPFRMELLALVMLFETLVKCDTLPRLVTVFVDCESALKTLAAPGRCGIPLLAQRASDAIKGIRQQNTRVSMHWVPSHGKRPGWCAPAGYAADECRRLNDKADDAARRHCEQRCRGADRQVWAGQLEAAKAREVQVVRFSSLAGTRLEMHLQCMQGIVVTDKDGVEVLKLLRPHLKLVARPLVVWQQVEALLVAVQLEKVSWRPRASKLRQGVEQLFEDAQESRLQVKLAQSATGEIPLAWIVGKYADRQAPWGSCSSSQVGAEELAKALADSQMLIVDHRRLTVRVRGRNPEVAPEDVSGGRPEGPAETREVTERRTSTRASTQLRQLLDFYFDPFTLQHNRYLLDLILKRAGPPQEKGPWLPEACESLITASDVALVSNASARLENFPYGGIVVMPQAPSQEEKDTSCRPRLTFVETRIQEIEKRKTPQEELRRQEEVPQETADVSTCPILLGREVFPSTSELIQKFKKHEQSCKTLFKRHLLKSTLDIRCTAGQVHMQGGDPEHNPHGASQLVGGFAFSKGEQTLEWLTFVETRIHEIENRRKEHEELKRKEVPQETADVNTFPILLGREALLGCCFSFEDLRGLGRIQSALSKLQPADWAAELGSLKHLTCDARGSLHLRTQLEVRSFVCAGEADQDFTPVCYQRILRRRHLNLKWDVLQHQYLSASREQREQAPSGMLSVLSYSVADAFNDSSPLGVQRQSKVKRQVLVYHTDLICLQMERHLSRWLVTTPRPTISRAKATRSQPSERPVFQRISGRPRRDVWNPAMASLAGAGILQFHCARRCARQNRWLTAGRISPLENDSEPSVDDNKMPDEVWRYLSKVSKTLWPLLMRVAEAPPKFQEVRQKVLQPLAAGTIWKDEKGANWPAEKGMRHRWQDLLINKGLPQLVRRYPKLIDPLLESLLEALEEFHNQSMQQKQEQSEGLGGGAQGSGEQQEQGEGGGGGQQNQDNQEDEENDDEDDDQEEEDDNGEGDKEQQQNQQQQQQQQQKERDRRAEQILNKVAQQWGNAADAINAADEAAEGADLGGNADAFSRAAKGLAIWQDALGRGASDGVLRLQQLAKILRKSPELRDLIRKLGRRSAVRGPLHKLPEEISKDGAPDGVIKSPAAPAESSGVTLSGTWDTMLPSEAQLLATKLPMLRSLHHSRRIEQSLLCYDRSAWLEDSAKTTGRFEMRPLGEAGPLIVCLDTSGSMMGQREVLSKALVVECVRQAHRQNRPCYLYAFSGMGDLKEIELDMSQDLLIVTDGQLDVRTGDEEPIFRARKEFGTRVYGLVLADYGGDAMERLCDELYVTGEVREGRSYPGANVAFPKLKLVPQQPEQQLGGAWRRPVKDLSLLPSHYRLGRGVDVSKKNGASLASTLTEEGYSFVSCSMDGEANTIFWDRSRWEMVRVEEGVVLSVNLRSLEDPTATIRALCFKAKAPAEATRFFMDEGEPLVVCADLSPLGGVESASIVEDLVGLPSVMEEVLGAEVAAHIPAPPGLSQDCELAPVRHTEGYLASMPPEDVVQQFPCFRLPIVAAFDWRCGRSGTDDRDLLLGIGLPPGLF